MPIEVACPSCEAPIKAPDKLAGKVIKCPRCEERIVLPEPEPSEEPKPEEEPVKEESTENPAAEGRKAAPSKTQKAGPAAEPAIAAGPAPRLRLGVLDGFRFGVGLFLAGLVAFALYVAGFWAASHYSKSVRKEWEEKVDGAVAKTMGGDLTMPNDPLPSLPADIRSLRAGRIWQGAKRGAHIILTTHSFLTNPQDLADIERYLQAGQWINYSKNKMFIRVDLSESPGGGSDIEYAPGSTLRVQMNDGRTVKSADLVKARQSQMDQSPWDPIRRRMPELEAMFGKGSVSPGRRMTFVAFMPEELETKNIKSVYWHFSASRRIKLEPYVR